MADPVLVVHGVANRDKGSFEAQVADLNKRTGNAWRFVPVFWGDLGARVEDLQDTVPQPRSLSVRGEPAAVDPALVASLLAGTGGPALTRSGEEGWRVVADAATGGAPDRSPYLVRGGEDAEVIRQAIAEEWAQTTTLQNVTDSALLAEIGRSIATGLSEEGDRGPVAVRGLGEELKARVKGLVKGIDQAVGAVVGLLAGRLNEFLRTQLGPGLGEFLGDVFVYQRHRREIESRLWEVVDREAPGWGTEQKPLKVVAHSLGGVLSFYTAVAPTGGRRLWIDRFVTFGSQSAFFHVLDPLGGGLAAYHHGARVELPPAIGGWTNLWEPLDPLAFLAGKVFLLSPASAGKAPTDVEIPHRASSPLWTHSVYWTEAALVEEIRRAFS